MTDFRPRPEGRFSSLPISGGEDVQSPPLAGHFLPPEEETEGYSQGVLDYFNRLWQDLVLEESATLI